MANIISREELLSLFREHEKDFVKYMQERIKSRQWKTTIRFKGVVSDKGNIYINNDPALLDVVGRIVSESAVDGVLSFIDILSKSDKSIKQSPDELENLNKRITRLEGELLKILPPDFINPSSENPSNN